MRLHQKAETARARRLCWKANGQPVVTPTLDNGLKYHVFLSHDWSSQSGRDVMRIIKSRLQELFAWQVVREDAGEGTHSKGSKLPVQKCLPSLKVFLDVDDLKHGYGEEHVIEASLVVFYISKTFFSKRNAMVSCSFWL